MLNKLTHPDPAISPVEKLVRRIGKCHMVPVLADKVLQHEQDATANQNGKTNLQPNSYWLGTDAAC